MEIPRLLTGCGPCAVARERPVVHFKVVCFLFFIVTRSACGTERMCCMQNLTAATRELFRRSPDEVMESMDVLYQRCQADRERSSEHWHAPVEIVPKATEGRLELEVGSNGLQRLNDWSFSQLCKLASVSKDTLNRLSPETAARALEETLPRGDKPLQLLRFGENIRSIHGASYTRLHNVDLLNVVKEFATDFQPPQKSKFGGGTGLYCGEQDMFVFLIDPLGWAEIEGEAFAPGFFLWNSEVGRRSVGIQTFWFQKVCANHIVWDAVEVVDFSRKHTANVHECLSEIRRHIHRLTEKRDERRDGFAKVMGKAFKLQLGDKADDVAKVLAKHGIPRDLGKRALDLAQQAGQFTVFAVVDALTRIAGEYKYVGDRVEIDQKASSLLALAAEGV